MKHPPKDNSANDSLNQKPIDSEATTDAPTAADSADSRSPAASESPGPRSPSDFYVSDQTADYAPQPSIYLGETLDQPEPSTSVVRGAQSSEPGAAAKSPTAHSSARTPTPDRYPSIKGYEIIGVLGRGAMGVVYKARQSGLKRVVALKMILAGDDANESELLRFRTEAEAAGQLAHPNIVQVHEVGEHNGSPFLSLEFVNGGSLKDRLKGEPQPVQPAAQLTQVLAQAIDYAHRKGIVHRDLKPANVMLDQPRGNESTQSTMSAAPLVDQLYGTPKVSDFGLAKRLEEDSGQTRSGTILGTPSYMAPEQARGFSKDVGPLADQHALGAILYELLTGRPPFRGATMWETIEQVQKQEPVPPSRLQPKVPRDLETICLKCLQKEPTRRYPDAAALAEDLRRFVAREPILARPVSPPERLMRWCRRNPKVAALMGSVAALVIAMLIGSIFYNVQLARETEEKEKQRKFAVEESDRANRNADEAKKNEERAIENAKVAMEQRKLALGALGSMVTTVQQELKQKPGTQGLQAKIVQIAMENLDRVAQNLETTISLNDSTKAAGHTQLGEVYRTLGETTKALAQFKLADDLHHKMAAADPDNQRAQIGLAQSSMNIGLINLRLKGQMSYAKSYFLEAKDVLLKVAGGPPIPGEDPNELMKRLAQVLDLVGMSNIDSNPEEALALYLASLAIREEIAKNPKNPIEAEMNLCHSFEFVSGAHERAGDNVKTRDFIGKSLIRRERMAHDHPSDLLMQKTWGFALQRLGDINLHAEKLEEANKSYIRARDIYLKLVQEDPKNVNYQIDLSRSYYDLGTTAWRQGNKSTARMNYEESRKIRQALADKDRADISIRKDLMCTLARCGQDVEAAILADSVFKVSSNDATSLVDVANCYALCYDAVGDQPNATAEHQKRRENYLQKSLSALRSAFNQGYRNVFNLENEPDLDPIRKNAEFKALLDGMKSNRQSVKK
jgi:serine/threonine-protein kinase